MNRICRRLTGPERYVISRALSKDASHRYATCREFVEALGQSATSYTDSQAKDSCPVADGVLQPIRGTGDKDHITHGVLG